MPALAARGLFLFLVLLGGCEGEAPRLSPLAPDAVVLAFGDSLTYGWNAPPDRSYPAVLERLIGRRVVRSGEPGETTAEGLERLPGVLAAVRPQLLILCLGGNDFLRRQDAAATEANLRAMIGLARARGVKVLLLGIPAPGLFGIGADTHGLYKRIADDMKVAYEGELMTEVLTTEALKSDMIHPNAAGYRRIAEGLAEVLRRRGAL